MSFRSVFIAIVLGFALIVAAFMSGFLVLGIQTGINVVGALIYPTSLRSNGSGWQLGIGRIGSIVGPLLGAAFVGLPIQSLYMWAAAPFAMGAVVAFIVHRLNEARRDSQSQTSAAVLAGCRTVSLSERLK